MINHDDQDQPRTTKINQDHLRAANINQGQISHASLNYQNPHCM